MIIKVVSLNGKIMLATDGLTRKVTAMPYGCGSHRDNGLRLARAHAARVGLHVIFGGPSSHGYDWEFSCIPVNA